LTALEIL